MVIERPVGWSSPRRTQKSSAARRAADGPWNWVSVECSSTDNNTNWGADGTWPDPSFSFPACFVNCACFN